MQLFKKVHCKAYLKKISDGVYIQFYNPDGSYYTDKCVFNYDIKAIAYKKYDENMMNDDEELADFDGSFKELADLSEFDDSYVEKVYRERVECEFDGFVVGYTKVNTKGIIGTGWDSGEYVREHGYCWKQITERPKVAVVYFKNNIKRYVLLDDMEIIE